MTFASLTIPSVHILFMPFYPDNLLFENLFPHQEVHYCKHLETNDIQRIVYLIFLG